MADEQAAYQGAVEQESAEIIQLFDHITRKAAPRGTADELAEYRRIKPLLLQMLAEFGQMRRELDLLKSAQGCPIANRLLNP